MQAHIGEGMVRPVGDPEDVPLLDAEREPQVFEVGGAFDRVVGAQVDAERFQPVPAVRARLRKRLPGFRRVERHVERLPREAVDVITGQARLCRIRPALRHEDHVAIAVEVAGERHRDLGYRVVAGTAGEPDDRIGLRVGRRGRDDGD